MTGNAPSTYTGLFESAKTSLPGNSDALLNAKRQEALHYFVTHGFPKATREEWKYTRLPVFLSTPLPIATRTNITRDMLAPFIISGLDCYRIVFVNGWFEAALSDSNISGLRTLANALDIQNAANALDEMEALNLAFMTDGIALVVSKNTIFDKPLYVLYVITEGAVSSRNQLLLEEGSKLTLIERYVTLPVTTSQSFTNVATTINLKPGATLEHYIHLDEGAQTHHVATTRVNLDAKSNYQNFSLTTGGALSRNAIYTSMQGEGASSKLHGIYLGRGGQHFDYYMPIYHHAPHCYSEQRYKGVLDGMAKGIFYGKVFVPQGAQETEAHQSHHTILLSEHAMGYSRPELEIHADNVKCSHGSATGNLDKAALFYLRSRGIGTAEAQALLVEGFVEELLEAIPRVSLKHYWQGVLHLWLKVKP